MEYSQYKENLKKFRNTFEEAIKVSMFLKGKRSSDRGTWACVLFTRMCVTSYSTLVLCPESPVAKKSLPHWDYASLHALTRKLMENFQTLYYLCFEDISDEEYFARKGLFNLHDYYSRKKMFELMGKPEEDKQLEMQLIRDMKQNEYFKALSEKQQKHFLKGNHAFFVSREDIESNYRKNSSEFKWLYLLYSNSVHSFPMGFYRMILGERGTGVKTKAEVGHSAFALEVAEGYVADAIKEMYKFFPGTKEQVLKMKAPFPDLA